MAVLVRWSRTVFRRARGSWTSIQRRRWRCSLTPTPTCTTWRTDRVWPSGWHRQTVSSHTGGRSTDEFLSLLIDSACSTPSGSLTARYTGHVLFLHIGLIYAIR